MDEQRFETGLKGAMRDAAADAPPPSFEVGDVVRTSKRITARRRAATAGAALAVVAVVGVGVGMGVTTTSGGNATTAAAPAPEAAPSAYRAAPPSAADAQGAESAAAPPAPLGPATGDACANPQDPELRALVDQVLPEVADAQMAPTTMECRPPRGRGVHLLVGEGVLIVDYAPPGEPSAPRSDGGVSVPTASGGTLQMVAPGTGITAEQLEQAAAELAPLL